MNDARRPADLLWHHLAPPAREKLGSPAAIGPLLEERLRAAKDAWPAVDLPDAVFVPQIAARLQTAPAPADALASLHISDLYLACACAEGHRAALAAFDARYIATLDRALQRITRGGVSPDDIKQILRQKLLVAEPGRPPKIADYAGRGDLRRWVHAVAVRSGIDALRAEKETPTEEALLDAIELGGDHPELAHLKDTSRAEFKAAFRDALNALPDRERSLLLQYHIDGNSLEELGALYHVVPSTISRSLAKARATLFGRVRVTLMLRMRLTGEEVDSLVRLLQSQFELSTNLLESRRQKPGG
ncbi:sigma-70 family RNA polymerase sigma factor [Polyangium jinanense]|uniref:Sigma-70 family RNA polymerase sigma factor n=1 Tax=Polyangium jinanense TaxID=2829994 RepID=A0A9X3X905_9BACT|nr:sigma-70 family RNA polymerase sigma factor [Polyangium jinanense]MDC3958978.1 sigma-70 family RNA polymerase sigma factor [Polyangium jinanense]MDC3986397.1 sigma-70 family RNA polymerase sigma factor [Polyangium jinanense]